MTAWVGIGLAYLVTAGDRVVIEQRNRQRVMDIFGAFLAPAVVRKLAADPKSLSPVRRSATIMFIDIVGYTSLTESLKREPDRLISLLNEYLGLLADVVRKHGGYVDKFIGDAVLAVWNVPTVERADAGRAAAEAALECADLVRAKGRARADGIKVDVRIGIASGEVTGGLVGSATRVNYTVLGDAVNLGLAAGELQQALRDPYAVLRCDRIRSRRGRGRGGAALPSGAGVSAASSSRARARGSASSSSSAARTTARQRAVISPPPWRCSKPASSRPRPPPSSASPISSPRRGSISSRSPSWSAPPPGPRIS